MAYAEKKKYNKANIKYMKIAQKLVYFAVLFVLIFILVIKVAECVETYFRHPTYIETKIVAQPKAIFPAMTVCPVKDGYKADVLEQNGISPVKKYNDARKYNLTWSSNDTNVDEETLFQQATYSLDEIVNRIYVRFIQASAEGNTNTGISVDGTSNSFKEQRHRGFGRCYTLHPEPDILKLGVYYLKAWFPIDVKLYFHGPDQFLDLSGRMGYKLYLGETMQSQITVIDTEILERVVKEPNEETGKEEDVMTCSKKIYDDCIYGTLSEIMRNDTKGGCRAPFIRDDNDTICTEPEDIEKAFWVAWNRVTNQKKDCLTPCNSLTVNLGAKNFVKKNATEQDYALLYLYYAPRVTKNIEHRLYTYLSLFAEIGGYVGLILGYSLFNVAAWISDIIEKRITKVSRD